MDSPTSHWTADQADALVRLILVEGRHYGVAFFDAGLCITGWNEAAHAITGWAAAEIVGQPLSTLFVPEDRADGLDEHEANTVRVNGVAEDERWHLRKDGSRFWSSGISMAVVGADGEPAGFLKVFRDVTHLRARMRYLENVQHQLNVRQREQDIFVGTIAHEMRNPLSPLKTALELMKRRLGDDPSHTQPLAIMERQLGFLERLVEDLVDLTRVHAGKMSVSHDTVVLQELLFEALDGCQAAAQAKGLTIHRVMPPVPIEVEVDPQRLLQVVLNLLNNAIKYTHAGGNVWLTATVNRIHFLIHVKDDGQGIGPELLPRIFEKFTQADPGNGERGAGLGIGLSVVKEIVALHQGTVEVRSQGCGHGSEFTVRIPRRRNYASEPEATPEPAQGGS
jgi:PAS domain S-box-containing protein